MPYKDPEKRRQMNLVYGARYRQTEHGKAARKRGHKLWEQRHPDHVRESNREKKRRALQRGYKPPGVYSTEEQLKARTVVSHAIAAGKLTKEPCRDCGELRVHAHHHLGYGPEHQLDVVWLCAVHHSAAHKAVGA